MSVRCKGTVILHVLAPSLIHEHAVPVLVQSCPPDLQTWSELTFVQLYPAILQKKKNCDAQYFEDEEVFYLSCVITLITILILTLS